MASNISLPVDGGKFNLRTGAIIFQNKSVLLCKNDGNNNYYVIGGRDTFGESTEEAIVREVREETKQKFSVDRLVFINENFFTFAKTGEKCHELCFYYLMKSRGNIELPKPVEESYGTVRFYWIPLSELSDIILLPKFLKSELKALPNSTLHVVTRQ